MNAVQTTLVHQDDPALEAYEALAPFYDAYTTGWAMDACLDAVEALARAHGLRGRRLLDVACGTGASFAPMLTRGYDVQACDLSPGMVDRARRRHPRGEAAVFVADMRDLPPLGPFDLVTCLDDAMNYLLDADDLAHALESIAGVLAPGGLLVFDVNSDRAYAEAFRRDRVREEDGALFLWRGLGADGPHHVADLEVLAPVTGGRFTRHVSRHVQRHHAREDVERACGLAGLDLLEARGLRPGAVLDDVADELLHPKLLYVARRP